MGKLLTIEVFQEMATRKHGKLLSTEYTNSKTKLKFECEKGHVFEKFPYSVRQGSWCPVCGREKSKEFFTRIVPRRTAEYVQNIDMEEFVRDKHNKFLKERKR